MATTPITTAPHHARLRRRHATGKGRPIQTPPADAQRSWCAAPASTALLVVTVSCLWTFGSRPVALMANIHAPLAAWADFLALPPGDGRQARRGHLIVNGARFNYVVGASTLPVDTVLSHYEGQFTGPVPVAHRQAPAVRAAGRGAGVVAGVRVGALALPGGPNRPGDRGGPTGLLRQFGEFHLVAAFEQRGTVFIDLSPAADVRLDALLPGDSGDAPGRDLEGVDRPPGLQRLLTIEHGDDAASRVWVYRAPDGRAAVQAFRSRFLASGWRPVPGPEVDGVTHYSKPGSEAFVATAGIGADSAAVVGHRQPSEQKREP